MSEDAARAAAERLRNDEGFRQRVLSVEDVDARLAVLVAEGYDCTAGELESRACALTDEALDVVTGAGDEHHHML
jgi:predicted ribosomally synthesized peptide with nif11-like leader